jgi:hypothetical protein
MNTPHRLLVAISAGAILVAGCSSSSSKAVTPQPGITPAAAGGGESAQDTLKYINQPGGAQVVYGTIDNQHTPQSAMAFMLKQVHEHFGDRPAVSKVFQIKNTTSYAAFFTLLAKNTGNVPIAGEVIVDMPAGAQPIAAVLYDNAATFTRSQPTLLNALNNAWHTANPVSAGAAAVASTPANSGDVQPLHRVTAGDRSVYISIPDGWKVDSVAGGSVTAEGPRGERLGLNLMYQGIQDPRVRNPYANPNASRIVYPMGGDVFTAYSSIVNQARTAQHLPPGTFHLNSSTPLGGGAVQVQFDLDLHDGFGARSATARLQEISGQGAPTWALSLSNSSLPKTIAAAENATLLAVIRSASQDSNVVKAEQGAVMQGIAAASARSNAEAQAANQQRVASAQAFDAHMDNIDSQSKAMQNYTLDRTQIQDNDANGRTTVSDGLADALIKADPTRYQVVPPSQFLKGVDY